MAQTNPNINAERIKGHLDLDASTVASAAFRIRPGSDVTTPNTGDIWNNGTFIVLGGGEGLKIGTSATTSLFASNSAISINAPLTGGYNHTLGFYNSRSATGLAYTRHFVAEGALNASGNTVGFETRNYNTVMGRFVSYTNAAGTTLTGTSVDLASAIRIDSTSGSYGDTYSGNGPLLFSGTPIYNIIGTTATNIGTRLDATGLRIGEISDLHTSNTVEFEVDGNALITGLAGTGNRMVEADASGNLVATSASTSSNVNASSKLFMFYNFI